MLTSTSYAWPTYMTDFYLSSVKYYYAIKYLALWAIAGISFLNGPFTFVLTTKVLDDNSVF